MNIVDAAEQLNNWPKVHITAALFRNALDLAELSRKAFEDRWPDLEVQYSIGAHLMCALALEGIINEVGEVVLKTWWTLVDKSNTPEKWMLASHFLQGGPFATGVEPVQTVSAMYRLRNSIVHPKSREPGDEVIVRTGDGRIVRDAPMEYVLKENDTVHFGLGKLLVEFNSSSAQRALTKTHQAFKSLKAKLPPTTPEHLIRWVTESEFVPFDARWAIVARKETLPSAGVKDTTEA